MQFDPLDSPDSYKFQIFKIQDGGGRHFEKSNNRYISAAVQPILTKFGIVKHFEPLDRPGRYLKKSKIDISPPWFKRLQQNLAQ